MKPELPAAALLISVVLLHSISAGQEIVPQQVSIGGGAALHYVERGEGEPIIFIHGLTGDYAIWMRQLEAFAQSGYRAIAYSRRYNYPNRNELRPNHSASIEAEDLAAFIRKLNLPKAHLMGHSYGGYTALILALEDPDLVRTLTLAEPPLVPWLADLPNGQADDGKAHFRKLMNEGVNPAKAAFESGDDEAGMRTIFDCIAGGPMFERLPAFVQHRCLRNINEVKAIMMSDVRYPAVDREQVRRLDLATLILSGSESQATARLTDFELEQLLPQRSRKRVVLQGATHNMWLEQPAQCREAVLEFIRGK